MGYNPQEQQQLLSQYYTQPPPGPHVVDGQAPTVPAQPYGAYRELANEQVRGYVSGLVNKFGKQEGLEGFAPPKQEAATPSGPGQAGGKTGDSSVGFRSALHPNWRYQNIVQSGGGQ